MQSRWVPACAGTTTAGNPPQTKRAACAARRTCCQGAAPLERNLATVGAEAIAGVPVPLRDLWNPATCPPALLPFLAWA
ncbi:phage tail protein I, partial [Cupriavidus sp. UGS-1]|uniref:phage tail protein I n=1 Tax=Cupriavidus sp. UGS-1 TaxID=2899826 RepID=UPI001E2DD9CD